MLGTAAAALRSTPFASALLKRERLQPSRRRPAQTAEAEDILKRSAGYVRLITPRKAETDKIDEESAPAQNVPDTCCIASTWRQRGFCSIRSD